jgi:hypothetical protein
MTAFNRSTLRRLQKLPQLPAIWEGDRRPMPSPPGAECILWVDTQQQIVLAVEVVPQGSSAEAMVRVLLRAMEQPSRPGRPMRPQRIVVRDREMQFYLRGALQDLDIAVEYAQELPLIEDAFVSLQGFLEPEVPQLPAQYEEALTENALAIWRTAPWRNLADHQILAIELNRWGIEKFYISLMGLLAVEYGVILYRSENSLRRFRTTIASQSRQEQLEEAYLQQDCLFLNYSHSDGEEPTGDLASFPIDEIEPIFGSLHPLEGLRASLDEEEAQALLVALNALQNFWGDHGRKLSADRFPALSGEYTIPIPGEDGSLAVTVATLPEFSAELFAIPSSSSESSDDSPRLHNDLIPDGSWVIFGSVPWKVLDHLNNTNLLQGNCERFSEELPAIFIQTSRPKAKTLIEKIKAANGLGGIGINPGEVPFFDEHYDLLIARLGNDNLYLLNDFPQDEPVQIRCRRRWEQNSKKSKGFCALLIAKGVTGMSQGQPGINDFVAAFIAPVLYEKDFGLGVLQLLPDMD